MFQFIQKHQKLIQIVMTLMFVALGFSGVAGVKLDSGSSGVVAKVGSQEITQKMFEFEFQNYKDAVSRQLGDKFDAAAYDTFEVRQAFLSQMVDDAVLKEAAQKEHLSVSDALLAQNLAQNPLIPRDQNGKVDFAAYEKMAKQRGFSTAQFEEQVRADLSSTVIERVGVFGNQALPLQQSYLQKMFSKVQMVEQKSIDAAPFLTQVTLESGKAQKYYQDNAAEFTREASFDLEYAVIPVLPAAYVPSDDEIKAAFGGKATAEEISSVRQDPLKLKQVLDTSGAAKMEAVAKSILEAASSNPKDLAAIVAKFGGKIESAVGVTRKGKADLPPALKSTVAREALTTSEMAASNSIGAPVMFDSGHLLVGRVLKSTASGLQPFESVQTEIEAKLKKQLVLVKIREYADQQLATMKPTDSIGSAIPMGLMLKASVSPSALAQILAVKDYPKLLVSQSDDDLSFVRVVSAADSVPLSPEVLQRQVANWQGISAQIQQHAFLQTLRERYSVKLYPENLGGRNNPAVKSKA